jgi:hypothetical protein
MKSFSTFRALCALFFSLALGIVFLLLIALALVVIMRLAGFGMIVGIIALLAIISYCFEKADSSDTIYPSGYLRTGH